MKDLEINLMLKPVEMSEDEEVISATPEPSKKISSKRRGRKMVDKTFFDNESGFMVTKKEFVSCSEESEAEEEKPTSKKPVKPSPVKAKKSPVKPVKPGQSKQSSIKNFFTKK